MPSFSEKLNTILETFADTELKDNGGKNSPEYKNLIAAIKETPSLQNSLEEAVKNEGIKSFVVGASDGADAAYRSSNQTLYLNSEILTGSTGKLVACLAHETNHALNKDINAQNLQGFLDTVGDIAGSDKPVHDYTSTIKSILEANKESEAKAEIAAWNAELEYLKSKQPDITLQNLFDQSSYMHKFIDVRYDEKLNEVVYESKKGINLSADLSIVASDENIKGVGEYYFDDYYKNSLGARRVGYAITLDAIYDRGAKIVIDMDTLGINPAEMGKYELDLGKAAPRATYYDSSDLNTEKYLEDTTIDKDITNIIEEYQNSTKEEKSRQREEQPSQESSEIKALHDKIGGFLYPVLEKSSVSQNHADSMVATAVQQAVDKKITADDVIHVGVDKTKNLIGVFTKDMSKMASFDAIEASKNDPEKTLVSAQQQLEQQPEQDLQRQLAQQTKERSSPSMGM